MSNVRENKQQYPAIRFAGFNDTWVQRKLGDLIEEKWIVRQSDGNHGNLYPRSEEFVDSGVPYVATSNISSDGNSIDFSTVKYLPQSRAELFKKGVAFDGDILLAHNATVGPVLRLNTSFDKVILSTTLTLYRVDSEKLDPDFFLQNLRSSRFQNQLFETMKQSTRNQVPILAQQKLSISITPNIDEQNRIGELLTLLDNLIAANQKKDSKLRDFKKMLLQTMFVSGDAVEPEIRFNGFTDAWVQRELNQVAPVTMGTSPKSENYTENPDDHILVQGNADMNNGFVSPRVWTTQVTKIAEAGDLILSVRAPVGEVGKTAYEVVLGRGVAGIKGNEFIFQSLKQVQSKGYWARMSSGSTFDSVTSEEVKTLPIMVPDEVEQELIGKFLGQMDDLIAANQNKGEKLRALKKMLLQQMFM